MNNKFKKYMIVLIRNTTLMLVTLLMITQTAFGEDRKWWGQFEGFGNVGNQRNEFGGKLMAPIRQSGRGLLYMDFRYEGDNEDSKEAKFGLGYRRIINGAATDEGAKVIGTYLFADRMTTINNNRMDRIVGGVELLTKNWDLRANAYIPRDNEGPVKSGYNGALYSGQDVNMKLGMERAMYGGDAEIGYRLPFLFRDFRVFAGGYYFDIDRYDNVKGPRTRGEFRINHQDIRHLPRELEIKLATQFEYDHLRGENYSVGLSFKYILSGNYSRGNSNTYRTSLSGIANRMEEFVVRR